MKTIAILAFAAAALVSCQQPPADVPATQPETVAPMGGK